MNKNTQFTHNINVALIGAVIGAVIASYFYYAQHKKIQTEVPPDKSPIREVNYEVQCCPQPFELRDRKSIENKLQEVYDSPESDRGEKFALEWVLQLRDTMND